MRHGTYPRRFLVSLAAMSLILAACGTEEGGETTTTGAEASTTTTAAGTTTTVAPTTTTTTASTTTTGAEAKGYFVYFMLDELDTGDGSPGPYLVPVYREAAPEGSDAETAMSLLLEGPSDDEIAGTPAISTAIPEGTTLLGVSIEGGLATVDLSGEYDDGGGSFGMFARLAQVVYTLTRDPTVGEVAFEIEGVPVTTFSSEGIELDGPQTREGYYDLLPAIFVDSPAWGEPVTSPVGVMGLSNVFEAVSQVMLTDDDGASLFEDHVMASCGTGCWGEWGVEIPYTVDREQFGALIVWEISAKDGSRVNIREYPVILG